MACLHEAIVAAIGRATDRRDRSPRVSTVLEAYRRHGDTGARRVSLAGDPSWRALWVPCKLKHNHFNGRINGQIDCCHNVYWDVIATLVFAAVHCIDQFGFR